MQIKSTMSYQNQTHHDSHHPKNLQTINHEEGVEREPSL